MLSITLQVNLHIAVHAYKHCVSDAFQSHNQIKGHVFEDDENKATIVAQSKQVLKHMLGMITLDLAFRFGGVNTKQPTLASLEQEVEQVLNHLTHVKEILKTLSTFHFTRKELRG